MECRDRKGEIVEQNSTQGSILGILYNTIPGRAALSVLIRPCVSRLAGRLLSTRISSLYAGRFIKNNHIDMKEYEKETYKSFNDFFMRNIKKGARPIDDIASHLISPCDSRLTAYKIQKDSRFNIKNTTYSLRDLLRSTKLADYYRDGMLLVFRLSVDDYHHYCYVDNGVKSKNYRIDGVLHTVQPLANDVYPIYRENSREYSLLKSENFGTILMMEVGALVVGKIVNEHEEAKVTRGQEKGHFEFGGSTVILCFRKGTVKIDSDIIENTKNGIETKVKLGEKIGVVAPESK